MNVKQTAKKITAVVTGAALFTGLTVSGAAALDLSDYPEPFIMDGAFNGKLVVGEIASSQDIVGAIDIAASLQAQAREAAGTVGSGVALEGGYDFEQGLNSAFPGTSDLTLDDRDLAGFQDRTIRHDGENVRVHEELTFVTNALDVRTSINSAINSEDYGTDAYLNVARDSVFYTYVFDDDVSNSTISTSRPLRVHFLGQELEITGIQNETMTLETARTTSLGEGGTFEVDGSTVTVLRIADGTARIDVDGEVRNIDAGDDFDFAADVVVEVEGVFFLEVGHEGNEVDLRIGETLTETVSDGDSLTAFGEPEDENEAEWLWEIRVDSNGIIESISAYNDIDRTEVEAEWEDERPALGVGDSMSLPNDYATITFEGFYDTASEDITFDFGSTRLRNYDSDDRQTTAEEYMRIRSSSNREPFRFDDIRAEEVFIIGIDNTTSPMEFHVGFREDGTSYRYSDADDDLIGVDEIGISLVRGQEDDVKIVPHYNTTGSYVRFEFDGETMDFLMDGNDGWEFFGLEERESESGDIVYNGDLGTSLLHNWDYGVKLTYGVTFDNPESQLESDRFTFALPHEKAEAIVTVTTSDTARGAVSGDAYRVNPLGTGIAILDREANVGSEPYIVVGGPRANTVAAELLGNPSNEEINDMFGPGVAMIKLFADQNALLVAGWEAQDTVRASYVLAQYQDYDLSGDEVEVVTADVNNLQVRTPQ